MHITCETGKHVYKLSSVIYKNDKKKKIGRGQTAQYAGRQNINLNDIVASI